MKISMCAIFWLRKKYFYWWMQLIYVMCVSFQEEEAKQTKRLQRRRQCIHCVYAFVVVCDGFFSNQLSENLSPMCKTVIASFCLHWIDYQLKLQLDFINQSFYEKEKNARQYVQKCTVHSRVVRFFSFEFQAYSKVKLIHFGTQMKKRNRTEPLYCTTNRLRH